MIKGGHSVGLMTAVARAGLSLLCCSLVAVARAADVDFGLYDAEQAPAEGWILMSAVDFTTHKTAFLKSYNELQGIKPIATFQSGNCCIAVKGGNKLMISGTPYGYQFPASTSGGIRCNPTGGYSKAAYQFYRSPELTDAMVFSEQPACATSHNPAVFMKLSLPEQYDGGDAASGGSGFSSAPAFGIFDFSSTPPGGWELMAVEDFSTYRAEFIAAYNKEGIPSLDRTFKSGNCCVAVKGGNKLVIPSSTYGFQFPADKSGALACSPELGYSDSHYRFYNLPILPADTAFSEKAACVTNRNPGIFVKRPTAAPPADHEDSALKISFGMYDREQEPGDGWEAMGAEDFTKYRAEFVEHYNLNGGISVIKLFQSGNCCIAVKSGLKLFIKGTPYGYQFPAALAGGIRCNPTGGYADTKYMFYRSPTLSVSQTFSEQPACATSHNPAVFMKVEGGKKATLEFGLYDREATPAGGWSLMGVSDFVTHRDKFVAFYNTNKGIAPAGLFQSGNCCIAVKSGKMLGISDTPYGYQFPASTSGGIRCNPTGGYTEARYQFYRAATLTATQVFSESTACAVSHNPAVFMRISPFWVAPTTRAPTPAPTPESLHCQVSIWATWSLCSTTCGPGTKSRTRHIVAENQFGGDACPQLSQVGTCTDQDCPQHCLVHLWGVWSDCNAICGGGTARRTRTLLQEPKYNGNQCPHLSETRACNMAKCPVHCSMTDWSSWSDCNAECGGGVAMRMRFVVVPAQFNGMPCPHSSETMPCNTHMCPVHCTTGAWGAFGACNAECGGGAQARTRSVLVSAQFNGDQCPSLTDSRSCKTAPCAIHCEVSKWGSWETCSASCGSGASQRRRIVKIDPLFNGNACPTLAESTLCNEQTCPIDCVVTDYGPWGACSSSCGNGITTRSRHVLSPVQHGGKACPMLSDAVSCASDPCPINCLVSNWGFWTDCTKTCGGGQHTRSRLVVIKPQHGGVACPSMNQAATCGDPQCPVHCEHNIFAPWSVCSKTCGGGLQARSRAIIRHAAHGGTACEHLDETQACSKKPCPIDCVVSSFGAWSRCSANCGSGMSLRARSVVSSAAHTGKACPSLSEVQVCNSHECPSACTVSGWGDWGACSTSCGLGTRHRTRSVDREALNGGKECPPLSQTGECSVGVPCPIDCQLARWGGWSDCTQTCGGGSQLRSRVILVKPASGGMQCDELNQLRVCGQGPCPIHCTISSWSSWTGCSTSCGGGTYSRHRSVILEMQFQGHVCPSLAETAICEGEPCPVDCVVGEWDSWGACSSTCDGGVQHSTRPMVRTNAHGGKRCPALAREQPCASIKCFCFADWGFFSECSASCGGGSKKRSRQINPAIEHVLIICPNIHEVQPCNEQACPVDCATSSWSAWSPCTLSCASREHVIDGFWGRRSRSRTVVHGATAGGRACPALTQDEICNHDTCPIDCTVGLWGAWGGCSATCGLPKGAHTKRHRPVIRAAAFGGADCAVLTQAHSCYHGTDTEPCPVDCALSSWSSWGACSKSCSHEKFTLMGAVLLGGGVHTRQRSVTRAPAYEGSACGVLQDTKPCETVPCPVNCEVTSFTKWGGCNRTCGGGTRVRSRAVLSHPAHDGWPCPALTESGACNNVPCAVDCAVSEWSDWSSCSATCETGAALRTRSIILSEANGGRACGRLSDNKACHRGACPIDCDVSEWGHWSVCSQTCGAGLRSRARMVVTPVLAVGAVCPNLSEARHCHDQPCPIDCVLSHWLSWEECDVTCGGGSRTRHRHVAQGALHGGACAGDSENEPCNIFGCPVDCMLSAWGSWSACSEVCHNGTQKRKRDVARTPEHGGMACTPLIDERACNTRRCTEDDQRACSHVHCQYRAHDIEHEKQVMNWPEKVYYRRGQAMGQFWHVGVRHTRGETFGMKHRCSNDRPGQYHTVQHACSCTCWHGEDNGAPAVVAAASSP